MTTDTTTTEVPSEVYDFSIAFSPELLDDFTEDQGELSKYVGDMCSIQFLSWLESYRAKAVN